MAHLPLSVLGLKVTHIPGTPLSPSLKPAVHKICYKVIFGPNFGKQNVHACKYWF